jgi:hypothetical protein
MGRFYAGEKVSLDDAFEKPFPQRSFRAACRSTRTGRRAMSTWAPLRPRAPAFMEQKRFEAKLIHTHTFELRDLPKAIRYANDRVDDAIRGVVRMPSAVSEKKMAAE